MLPIQSSTRSIEEKRPIATPRALCICKRAKNASLFSADENGLHFGNGPHFENGPHLIMTVNSHIVLEIGVLE